MRPSTLLAILVIVVASGVFAATLVHATLYAPDSIDSSMSVPTTTAPAAADAATAPDRLLIPSLSIDAHVQRVGVNAKGLMSAPSNFTDVAWYKNGTIPGKLGSAVIDGHVDNGLGLAGVFKHLGDIQIGDDVYIVTASGAKLHFIVKDIERYPYTGGPVDTIFNAHDAARLNLITCAGSWVKGGHTYNERLVVYTTYADTVAS
jgi:sortase (surface protein transpeptidase)